MDQKLVELSIAASEARTDTKFAQLIGKIDALADKVSDLKTVTDRVETKTDNTKLTIIVSVIGTGLAIAALVYAAVQIFQSGMGVSASAYSAGMAAAEARKNDHTQTGPGAGQTGAVRSGAAGGRQNGGR